MAQRACRATRRSPSSAPGAMGAGIAQIAAQAGHPVRLFDTRMGAADEGARGDRRRRSQALAAKGKLDARRRAREPRRAHRRRARARRLRQRRARRRGDRRGPRRQARRCSASSRVVVARDAILATNTSSLSITAIAAGTEASGARRRHAFLQSGAAACRWSKSSAGSPPTPRRRRHALRDRRGVGQGAGARDVDAGIHRQPLRAAVLRRGAAPARRARRRRRDDRRRDARGRRLPHGPVRADGPDRPRRQLRRDAKRVGGVLPRSALHAVGAAAASWSPPASSAARAGAASTTTRAGARSAARRDRAAAAAPGADRRARRSRACAAPLVARIAAAGIDDRRSDALAAFPDGALDGRRRACWR